MDSRLAVAFIAIVAIVGFALYFSSSNSEQSVTGYVLPALSADSQVFDVLMRNSSIRLDGTLHQLTFISFVARRGGQFVINDTNVSSFYLAIQNQSVDSWKYVGRIIYKLPNVRAYAVTNVSCAYSSASRTCFQWSPWRIDFSHIVTFNTANRTSARLSFTNITISGTTYNDTSTYWLPYLGGVSGIFTMRDGQSSLQNGTWHISFKHNYPGNPPSVSRETGFGTVSNGVRRVEYRVQNRSDSFSVGPYIGYINIAAGFKSPAEVNLTHLNQLDLRFSELANPGVSFFGFTCVDSDGGNYTSVPGALSLTYGDGYTAQISADDCATNVFVGITERICNGNGVPGSVGGFSPIRYPCPGACNAEGTACAS